MQTKPDPDLSDNVSRAVIEALCGRNVLTVRGKWLLSLDAVGLGRKTGQPASPPHSQLPIATQWLPWIFATSLFDIGVARAMKITIMTGYICICIHAPFSRSLDGTSFRPDMFTIDWFVGREPSLAEEAAPHLSVNVDTEPAMDGVSAVLPRYN